ncbi:MAG: hypothetical protein K8R11_06185 [Methanococcoides sp.]|nr:hypothetical protein [Methanococcoides sp.]
MQNKFHNFFKKLHNLWVQSAPIISTVSSILFGIFLVVVLEPISNFLSTVMEALIILFISGIVLGLLEKKIKYSREERFTFISLVLLFTFVPTVYKSFFTSNTSASITLSLIIVLFAIRYIVYYFYIFISRKQEDTNLKKKWNASSNSYKFIMIICILLFPIIKIQAYTILLMFLIYTIYDYIKMKYLPTVYKKSKTENPNNITKYFSSVYDIDLYAWVIVLALYMLYTYGAFSVEKQTMYYFYSTIAQVFSALLGIIIMFGILILQREKETSEKLNRIIFLKKGLLGFSLLYVFVIMLSILGILVVNDIVQGDSLNLFLAYESEDIRNFLDMSIFEMCFLMSPVALLYLYALVTEFLKLDQNEDDEFQKMLSDF